MSTDTIQGIAIIILLFAAIVPSTEASSVTAKALAPGGTKLVALRLAAV